MLQKGQSILGQRVKMAREKLGLSQSDLAVKLGYKSPSTIARIESGENDLTQTKVMKFSNALNVPVGFLLGDAMKGNLSAETSRNVSTDAVRIAAVLRKLQANVNAAFDAAIADVLSGNL